MWTFNDYTVQYVLPIVYPTLFTGSMNLLNPYHMTVCMFGGPYHMIHCNSAMCTYLMCLPRCAPHVILHNLYPPRPPRSLHRCKMMAYIPHWRGEAVVVAGGKV